MGEYMLILVLVWSAPMVFMFGALVQRFGKMPLDSPFTGPLILVALPLLLAAIWPLTLIGWLILRKVRPPP